jgi:hypothetical protein
MPRRLSCGRSVRRRNEGEAENRASEEAGLIPDDSRFLIGFRYYVWYALNQLRWPIPQSRKLSRRELTRLKEMSRMRYVPALYFAMVHNSLGETATALKFGWAAVADTKG